MFLTRALALKRVLFSMMAILHSPTFQNNAALVFLVELDEIDVVAGQNFGASKDCTNSPLLALQVDHLELVHSLLATGRILLFGANGVPQAHGDLGIDFGAVLYPKKIGLL